MKGFRLYLLLAIGGILLDQVVKAWVRAEVPPGGSIGGKPWPGVFEITLTFNKGIAFGLFQGAGVFMAPIALGMALAAGVYSFRNPKDSMPSHAAMGLLASGAVGNLIDRVAFGKVTDMFWFRLINFPVFNVADACITIATGLLLLTWLTDKKPEKKPQEPPKDLAASTEE
jgi:signal peptidase II